MSNFWILFKNNIISFVGKLRGKKGKKSFLTASILLSVGLVLILAFDFYLAYIMFQGIGSYGMDDLCLFHGVITSLSVLVIIGIMRVSANSKTKDSDLLLSLPIRRSEIIISKSISRYLFDFFFSILLFSPYFVFYVVRNFSFQVLFTGLFLVFAFPLLSLAISFIFDFCVSRIFNKFKSGRFLTSVVSVFIYILVMVLLIIKTSSYGAVINGGIADPFSDRVISKMVFEFMLKPSAFNVSMTLIMFIVPFVVGMILYAKSFGRTFGQYRPKNKELKFCEPNNFNLFKKEIGYYLNTPAYIINTIIGPILIIIFSIVLSIYKNDIMNLFGFDISMIVCIFIVAMNLFLSLTVISGCSISLEGKSVWILKSSPINEGKLFSAKALCHFVITEPAVILASFVLLGTLKLTFLQFLLMFSIPTILNLLLSFGGLFINICLPNFEFDNEIKVVKQGTATLLSTVFGVLLTIFPVVLYFAFKSLAINYIILATSLLYMLLLIIFVVLLFTVGIKKFRKIN